MHDGYQFYSRNERFLSTSNVINLFLFPTTSFLYQDRERTATHVCEFGTLSLLGFGFKNGTVVDLKTDVVVT